LGKSRLRSVAIVIALAFSTALAVWATTPAPKGKSSAKKTTAKKSTKSTSTKLMAKSSKSAPKKTASGKQSASTKQAASKKASGKSAKTAATSYRRSTQREPAPERYKEIQQSLADKGYFAGPVNGTWNSDSVEALKRFQRDQNIGDDGKIGSLTLIALGLGPKRGAEKSENSETSPTPP
jgi:peptidoglycan hydrolase-like protein with peptidoglycan-binding domain